MRFIEDHGVGAGQDVTEALLLQRQVRQQQMVVDHHQVRFIGAAARRKHMAAAEFGAAATGAAVAGGGEPLAQADAVRQFAEFRRSPSAVVLAHCVMRPVNAAAPLSSGNSAGRRR